MTALGTSLSAARRAVGPLRLIAEHGEDHLFEVRVAGQPGVHRLDGDPRRALQRIAVDPGRDGRKGDRGESIERRILQRL